MTLRRAARCPARVGAEKRAFSTTPCHNELSRLRTGMFEFLNKLEKNNERKDPGPSYLGGPDQPFPHNPFFRSQPVLDENAKEMIWRRVQRDKEPLKVVSADLGVDVRRVAAVVRLKEIEKSWVTQVSRLHPLRICDLNDPYLTFMMIRKQIRLVFKTVLCTHGYNPVASLSEKVNTLTFGESSLCQPDMLLTRVGDTGKEAGETILEGHPGHATKDVL